MTPHKIGLLGHGSIGSRRARILREMGHEVVCGDVNPTDGVLKASEWHAAVKDAYALMFCTPPDMHRHQVCTAREMYPDKPLWVEKPVTDFSGSANLLPKDVAVACNLRYAPMVKNGMGEALLRGNPISAIFQYTGWLPDWRPDTDYRESVSAQIGAALECIHEIDLALWLFGPAKVKECKASKARSLFLDCVGAAEFVLRHDSGTLTTIRVSFDTPNPPDRRFLFAWLGCAYMGHTMCGVESPNAIDAMYRDEMADWLWRCEQGAQPMATVEDGIAALRIAEMAEAVAV